MLPKFEKFLVLYLVVVPWLNFITQITLRHFLPMPMNNKILECKGSLISVSGSKKIHLLINVFFMVKNFLNILWWRFFVPHSEHVLVSRATLLCKTQNTFTLSLLVCYNTNSFFLRSFSLMHWLLNFITSKYSFFRRII